MEAEVKFKAVDQVRGRAKARRAVPYVGGLSFPDKEAKDEEQR